MSACGAREAAGTGYLNRLLSFAIRAFFGGPHRDKLSGGRCNQLTPFPALVNSLNSQTRMGHSGSSPYANPAGPGRRHTDCHSLTEKTTPAVAALHAIGRGDRDCFTESIPSPEYHLTRMHDFQHASSLKSSLPGGSNLSAQAHFAVRSGVVLSRKSAM